ncbi:sensor histidine kinase [Mucilaginibacter agri]|uniref:sensor histidine kinase n=1 Tax=Mucilaginibacter agri TaxID=2695265 RepID=UPI001AA11E63|nr:HAMP domain-containing sensor histidine kinase [Mucilaginibacter agri]
MACFYIPYDLYAGMYVASLSCLILAAVFFYQYYYSRYHHKKHNDVVFGLAGLIIFSVNYFANSGINGSTDLIWPAYLLLLLAISPYRQHLAWLIIYVLTFLILHAIGYYYPTLVQYPFSGAKGMFIDRITAFPIPVVTIYLIIKFIRRSYDKEKNIVELRNEEITLQKSLLEQSNAEKNKLMSIISHDMRAPLINIQSYLRLLNENAIDKTERPELEKDLLAATNNTMQMLSNLLYWTKSQMERPSINLQTLNLFSALRSTLDMEKTLAEKKGIALNYNLDDTITVIADTDMLQLVVRNLVSNAIKFTPKGGAINIDALILGGKCKLTVSDNGKGIAPAEQENIFRITSEPAFGTNNERGVGLGLLLCKEFIERQGGSIGFESIFGQGSAFFIFIASKPDPE